MGNIATDLIKKHTLSSHHMSVGFQALAGECFLVGRGLGALPLLPVVNSAAVPTGSPEGADSQIPRMGWLPFSLDHLE